MRDRVACKYAACSAFITFVKNKDTGRSMPLDAMPFPRDDVRPNDRFTIDEHDELVRTPSGTEPEVFVTHFITCPGHMPEREQRKMAETQPVIAARLESYRRKV